MISRMWFTWFLAFVFFIVFGLFLEAHAAVIGQAKIKDVVISITNEPCNMTDVVAMPYRATWLENGKTFEGCAAGHPSGLIILYFRQDKSIALVPAQLFEPLSSM